MIPNTYRVKYYVGIDDIPTVKITSAKSKDKVEERINEIYQGNIRIIDITRIDK